MTLYVRVTIQRVYLLSVSKSLSKMSVHFSNCCFWKGTGVSEERSDDAPRGFLRQCHWSFFTCKTCKPFAICTHQYIHIDLDVGYVPHRCMHQYRVCQYALPDISRILCPSGLLRNVTPVWICWIKSIWAPLPVWPELLSKNRNIIRHLYYPYP